MDRCGSGIYRKKFSGVSLAVSRLFFALYKYSKSAR